MTLGLMAADQRVADGFRGQIKWPIWGHLLAECPDSKGIRILVRRERAEVFETQEDARIAVEKMLPGSWRYP